jgi:hypothetical protein
LKSTYIISKLTSSVLSGRRPRIGIGPCLSSHSPPFLLRIQHILAIWGLSAEKKPARCYDSDHAGDCHVPSAISTGGLLEHDSVKTHCCVVYRNNLPHRIGATVGGRCSHDVVGLGIVLEPEIPNI